MPVVVFKPCTHDFNPRPREDGDTAILGSFDIAENFNPRPREEGDTL